ncbi:MAG: hypothetical protein U0324_46180 [Polyangiales bacterium]
MNAPAKAAGPWPSTSADHARLYNASHAGTTYSASVVDAERRRWNGPARDHAADAIDDARNFERANVGAVVFIVETTARAYAITPEGTLAR